MTTPTLMRELSEILGPETAIQSRWQHRARSNPRLLESVLAEIKMLKTERRIIKSPAAAAEDLWSRLSPEEDEQAVVEKSA